LRNIPSVFPVTQRIKHLFRALLLSGALLCVPALLSAAPASAAKVPCWKELLNDWYDGSISKTYPIPCYHEAINHLPADVEVYSSAKDDINNALAAALKKEPPPPEKTTTQATTTQATTAQTTTASSTTAPTTSTAAHTTTSATTTSSAHTTTTSATTTAATTTASTTTTAAPTTTDAKPPKKKNFFAKLTPGGPQSFPLPLLILGALAILLVAAGAAGMIWRRLQERDSGNP
jgi:cobalamin biosynthesis Mg chelatase CobN